MSAAWIPFSLIVGVLLGMFYFGGLWLTIRAIPTMKQPGLWLFCSFVVRTVVVLLGFFVVMNGRWETLVICMAGFLCARLLIVRHLRGEGKSSGLSTPQ